ncbi:hypothetical protein FHS29_003638 [Saccharothrix tamanrassetensis]|uniref:Uncharacterized protein n=1 Tax=Saccharothrix tamanrassetensis TaxID=1051531 RepID=A0A841CM12_9PSEU|nr:hypothetical protein [Saccharothrix tamanrassetensis]MBB5957045.1 hypothetical protein [Saccharothrix tamanrassetensis]
MKVKAIALIGLATAALAVLPTAAYASCSMDTGQTASVSGAVDEELARLAPWKPGSDPRDVAWLKANLVDMVPDWLPETRDLATRAKPEIDQLIEKCYQAADYSAVEPGPDDFFSCVKRAVLTEFLPTHLADWSAVCGEVRNAVQDPGIEQKIREWARKWVDAFIEHVNSRPTRHLAMPAL